MQSLECLIANTVFNPQVRKYLEDEATGYRLFTRAQKDVCWDMSSKIPGRDPAKWRFDAVGNPVIYGLRGCRGALCHEYDHVWPHSKGGRTRVLENCQVLQTQANRRKSNRTDMDIAALVRASRRLKLSQRDMDFLEEAIIGPSDSLILPQ